MAFLALIDYGMGNLLSVAKALTATGLEVRTATAPAETVGAAAIVLPGVGNFGDGMRNLTARAFPALIRDWIAADRPFLGICLGMQMLMESSEEAPGVPGLGIFRGRARRFPTGTEKVPHMGWNTISPTGESSYFQGLPATNPYVYFVHSYYVENADPAVTAAVTDYILPFTSALARGRSLAVQFHPEKSQDNGLRILQNFVARLG